LSHPPSTPDWLTAGWERHRQQEAHFNRAIASLRQTLSWYGHWGERRYSPLKSAKTGTTTIGTLKPELDILNSVLEKLDRGVIRIATFGLVSRGKSAVLNALLGEKVLPTSPLNGVTQWPRSVRWTVAPADSPEDRHPVQIELIDTPGLDEIHGQVRAEMAQEVARQADLILFVIAGDITRTEYRALCELRRAQKPMILVFNKIDLYPEQDRQAIYQQLQQLGSREKAEGRENLAANPLFSAAEIVLVAAEPAPIEVRVEWADGKVSYEWEQLPPQVGELQEKIWELLNREGRSLLALNALVQAREAEASIAQKTVTLHQAEAEALIWQFAKYKALAVALNPIAIVDILAASLADLVLIRSLARLYGLPMTGYEVGKLWKTIVLSAGGLLLGELSSSILLGFGKSAAAVATGDNPINLTAYAGTAIAQGAISGYGAYTVGRAAQVYLEQGCTWGELGANAVIKEILSQVEPNTILYRLRQELQP